jgi:hypothetical protein
MSATWTRVTAVGMKTSHKFARVLGDEASGYHGDLYLESRIKRDDYSLTGPVYLTWKITNCR